MLEYAAPDVSAHRHVLQLGIASEWLPPNEVQIDLVSFLFTNLLDGVYGDQPLSSCISDTLDRYKLIVS
jgi:hypothetical protein